VLLDNPDLTQSMINRRAVLRASLGVAGLTALGPKLSTGTGTGTGRGEPTEAIFCVAPDYLPAAKLGK
jgi:hypothetical protein